MTLREALNGPRVLVMDAATGTALLAAGVRSVNAAPLAQPELVRSIHAEHVAAGAEVVLTCTFQSNPGALAGERREGEFEAINRAGVALAREAGAKYVLGSIGPCEGAAAVLVADALRTADGYLLETWSEPAALEVAGRLAERGGTVLLSLAYHRGAGGPLVTHSGHPPGHFAREARRHGVAALGVNCGRDIGVRDVIEILRRYREETDLPLFARPNAGAPGPGGAYPLTPEALAEAVPGMVAAGARMVGGCCGTAAGHVAAVAGAVHPSPQPPPPRGEGGPRTVEA